MHNQLIKAAKESWVDALNVKQIGYFVTLAQELHFGRAAMALHLTQPALSQQIKKLEQSLGFALFHRDKRHVALTPEGQAFLPQAEKALAHQYKSQQLLDDFLNGCSGRLQLGYVGSALLDPNIIELLRRFKSKHPDLELSLQELSPQAQLRLLETGELDAGLLRGPLPQPAGLEIHTLASHELVAVVPEQTEYEGQSIELAKLKQQAFILVDDPPGIGLASTLLSLCQEAGFTPQISHIANSISAVVGMVAIGLGVSLIPKSMAASSIEGVRYLPLSDKSQSSILLAFYRKNSNQALAHLLESVATF